MGAVMNDSPEHQAPELVIFATRVDAHMSGFFKRRHRHYPWIRAWWPELGADSIRGAEWARVTIATDAYRFSAMQRDGRARRDLDEAIRHARLGLRREPMVWLEL